MAIRRSIAQQDVPWYVYAIKATLPLFSCLILMLWVISNAIITNLEGLSVLLIYVSIFYWSFHGFRYFHPVMVLFLGLWLDLLMGKIIGVYGLVFLLCYMICNIIRGNFLKSSALVSVLFFFILAFIPIIAHIIITTINGYTANIGQILLSLLISSVLYLPIHGILSTLQKKLW